jgi:hypothetical protein
MRHIDEMAPRLSSLNLENVGAITHDVPARGQCGTAIAGPAASRGKISLFPGNLGQLDAERRLLQVHERKCDFFLSCI